MCNDSRNSSFPRGGQCSKNAYRISSSFKLVKDIIQLVDIVVTRYSSMHKYSKHGGSSKPLRINPSLFRISSQSLLSNLRNKVRRRIFFLSCASLASHTSNTFPSLLIWRAPWRWFKFFSSPSLHLSLSSLPLMLKWLNVLRETNLPNPLGNSKSFLWKFLVVYWMTHILEFIVGPQIFGLVQIVQKKLITQSFLWAYGPSMVQIQHNKKSTNH